MIISTQTTKININTKTIPNIGCNQYAMFRVSPGHETQASIWHKAFAIVSVSISDSDPSGTRNAAHTGDNKKAAPQQLEVHRNFLLTRT